MAQRAYSTVQGAGQAIGPVLAGYLIAMRRFDLAFLLAGVPSRFRHPHRMAMACDDSTIRLERPVAAATVFRWHQGGRARASRPGSEPCAIGAVPAERLPQCVPPAYARLRSSAWASRSRVDVRAADRHHARDTAADRYAVGPHRTPGRHRHGLATCSAAVWMIRCAERQSPVAAVFAYAAGVAVTTAATSAYVTDVAPRARYGAAHGVFGTIYDVGDAAGPIVAGLLVAAWGYAPMFQVMAVAAIAAAAVFYVFSTTGGQMQT